MIKEKKENKIKKIVIDIEGKEITLSFEAAKELRGILEDLFGKEVVHEHHDHWHYRYWNSSWIQPMWAGNTTSAPKTPEDGTIYLSAANGLNTEINNQLSLFPDIKL